MEETTSPTRSSEWTNFIILVVILLGTILVVVMIRPFVFDHVVPAILGEGIQDTSVNEQDSPPVVDEGTTEEEGSEELETAVDATETETEPTEDEASETETAEGETSEIEAAEGEDNDASNEIDPESLPESVATIEHVVQPGDTLYALARNYKVSVSDIVDANKLSNPDRLAIGSKLLIPQPED